MQKRKSTKKVADRWNFKKSTRVRSALSISTAGYCQEIRVPQMRHLPRSNKVTDEGNIVEGSNFIAALRTVGSGKDNGLGHVGMR